MEWENDPDFNSDDVDAVSLFPNDDNDDFVGSLPFSILHILPFDFVFPDFVATNASAPGHSIIYHIVFQLVVIFSAEEVRGRNWLVPSSRFQVIKFWFSVHIPSKPHWNFNGSLLM